MKTDLRELSDNTKCINIHIIGIPEKEEKVGQKTYLKK